MPARISPVLDLALLDLVAVIGTEEIGHEVGSHMTCTEAEAITRVLLALDADAAAAFLAGHALVDNDTPDLHHWPFDERYARARAHLDTL